MACDSPQRWRAWWTCIIILSTHRTARSRLKAVSAAMLLGKFRFDCNSLSDGYTVSDVVMYWRSTPIRGVEEAELPQFTIMGYETNDRKVWSLIEMLYWLTRRFWRCDWLEKSSFGCNFLEKKYSMDKFRLMSGAKRDVVIGQFFNLIFLQVSFQVPTSKSSKKNQDMLVTHFFWNLKLTCFRHCQFNQTRSTETKLFL